LGLLYALAEGNKFTSAEVPEELATKREKVAARVEKADADKPVKVNTAALAKKIKAQLDGIDLLEKLAQVVIRLGIGNMNAKTAHELEDQARQLDNAYPILTRWLTTGGGWSRRKRQIGMAGARTPQRDALIKAAQRGSQSQPCSSPHSRPCTRNIACFAKSDQLIIITYSIM
jgi:hypothetical protein